MPSDNLRDDLPAYQQSALVRVLTARLVARAQARREALQRQPLRVRATVWRPAQRDGSPQRNAPSNSGDGQRGDRTQPRALPRDPAVGPEVFDGWLGQAERPRDRQRHTDQ